jgi:hypothetical protein
MAHKLRKAMGDRDDRYTLEGMIEMDEGYFTIEASEQEHQTQKAGRGSKTLKFKRMEKIFVRKCERYTVWTASEPIEVDVEKLRKCEPPFEGDTEEELLRYLMKNIWFEEFYNNTKNQEVYGTNAVYDLSMEECDMETYSDTRDNYQDEWLDVGVPNDEWRKLGDFEVMATSANDKVDEY